LETTIDSLVESWKMIFNIYEKYPLLLSLTLVAGICLWSARYFSNIWKTG